MDEGGRGRRAEVHASSARTHGGLDPAELRALGLDPGSVVDFSVNLNPYGPCQALLRAAHTAPLACYPDPSARLARAAWARVFACELAQVAVGHGAAELLWTIARALLGPGARLVIAEPTFSELRGAARAIGARLEQVWARPEQDFCLDLDELARRARGARMLYLCSPNNPTGEYLSSARVARLARALEGSLIVLDQSFASLSDHASDDALAPLPDNVLRVRSLTKDFACPGLRIGLCVANATLIEQIEAARPSWAISAPALAAIEAAAHERAFVEASWRRMRADRDALAALLRARGLAPRPSDTCFQLVPVGQPAHALRARLLARAVSVRDCGSFGLPRHLRLAALPERARSRLSAALDAVFSA